MNNLAIITSENFDTAQCDFWRDDNGEIWMTREQIGRALEYNDPRVAISKIHDRHKDRLNKFSTVTNLVTVESGRNVVRDIIVYSTKGVYEICRWSKKTKADAFMDWTWDVIEKIKNGKNLDNLILSELADKVGTVVGKVDTGIGKVETIEHQIIDMKDSLSNLKQYVSKSNQSYNPSSRPLKKNNALQLGTTLKLHVLAKHLGTDINKVLSTIYTEISNSYKIDLNDVKAEYCFANGLNDCSTFRVVQNSCELKDYFDRTLVEMFIRLGIYPESKRLTTTSGA